jgi:6-phosphogluconolactonase/glucosamine-6-phosphate isomerase/deaminase
VTNHDDAHPHQRVTFTFAGIARCHVAVVTVSGADKADALARLHAGADLPASHIAADEVVWLVDAAALGDS